MMRKKIQVKKHDVNSCEDDPMLNLKEKQLVDRLSKCTTSCAFMIMMLKYYIMYVKMYYMYIYDNDV